MPYKHQLLVDLGRKLAPYFGRTTMLRARFLLGRWVFPALLNRQDVVQHCLHALSSQAYLEIGVFSGHLFCGVQCPIKVGVDPIPPSAAVRAEIVSGRARYFQCTSDDFFSRFADQVRSLCFRVCFIDGLHQFEQSYRDLLNCLFLVKEPPWVILLHDCNPLTREQAMRASSPQEVARITGVRRPAWSGDVWKTMVAVRRSHPHLFSGVLDCDHGIGVVMPLPAHQGAALLDPQDMDYEDLARRRRELLNLMPGNAIYRLVRELKRHWGARGAARSGFPTPGMPPS